MRQNTINNTVIYTQKLLELTKNEHDIDKIILPAMGTLNMGVACVQNSNLEFEAQNFAPLERIQVFMESDILINQKLLLAMSNGLSVILCIGEIEKSNDTHSLYFYLKKQLFNALLDMKEEYFERLIIAYTPKWAVGKSTRSNTPRVHFTCQMIRKILEELFLDSRLIKSVRVVYGGSVSSENTCLIISNKYVDGVLVGSDSSGLLKIITCC